VPFHRQLDFESSSL